jgi:hypothetical protein
MNRRFACCVFLTLTLTLVASAQGGKPGGGHSGTTPTTSSNPTLSTAPSSRPDPSLGQRALISGKVVLDDGTEITDSANILTICRGSKRAVAHTDSHGGFSFELGDPSPSSAGIGDAGVDSVANQTNGGGGASKNDWRECELLAELPGFISLPIDLSSRLSTFETANIGSLVLHRVGQVEGLTISATSAMAPKDAQKAYTKGQEKANKQKWTEAQQLLTKAVEIYPKYAVAWFDLGRVQMHNNDIVAARHSFEQSIAADSKYVNPYRGLAELDTQQQNWPALVTVTGQVLALNPVYFPDAWFRNALANYYLHNFKEAEKSARQGMKVDDQHRVPKLEYLLGVILIQTHNYPEAAVHIQNYLKGATQPADIEDAQKQLAEITRLSASVNAPTSETDKK